MPNLDNLYKIAKEHKDNHKSCGGEPYKSYENLFRIINNFSESKKVLEIGTAVGFTTYILQNNRNFVDTIEFHKEHADLAKLNIQSWGGDTSKISFLVGDAQNILPSIKGDEIYDIIFFDGYGAKLIFYDDFERLSKTGGILITANQHLKSTESDYFKKLENKEKWQFVEEFADTKVYKKTVIN